MDLAELIKAVRAECGKVEAEEELHDDDITRESGYIMERISDRITDKRLRFITSEVDVREYSPHDDTIRVADVFDSDTQADDSMILGSHHAEGTGEDADEFYQWPSLYAIKQQRRVQGLPALQWGWNPVRQKITIDPMPSQAGIKYWYISVERANWTLVDLPAGFIELLVTGTTWKCLEIVLMRRSDLGGIQRSEGMTDYPASALKGFIDTKKDDFFSLLKFKAQLYGAR